MLWFLREPRPGGQGGRRAAVAAMPDVGDTHDINAGLCQSVGSDPPRWGQALNLPAAKPIGYTFRLHHVV